MLLPPVLEVGNRLGGDLGSQWTQKSPQLSMLYCFPRSRNKIEHMLVKKINIASNGFGSPSQSPPV